LPFVPLATDSVVLTFLAAPVRSPEQVSILEAASEPLLDYCPDPVDSARYIAAFRPSSDQNNPEPYSLAAAPNRAGKRRQGIEPMPHSHKREG
jgi:hypothetical protein